MFCKYREAQSELPGKFERGPSGKEADKVVPGAFEFVRQAALLQSEEVVSAHGPAFGHGAGRDCGRAREVLKIKICVLLGVDHKNGYKCMYIIS